MGNQQGTTRQLGNFQFAKPSLSGQATAMPFFKRLEVWLLLAVGLAATLWVLLPEPTGNDTASADPAAATAPNEPALQVLRCTLERDFGNARLDIELRYANPAPRPLLLAAPDVRLFAADGTEVPFFVLPATPVPQIAERASGDANLRFWLEKKHLAGALTLDIRGARTAVKSPAPLDLETLENRKPRSWSGPIQ
jgi:hypothetical protein